MTVFFDTNVLVYCTDKQSPAKQAIARELVERHSATGQAVISTQVLIELYNVLVNKQKVPASLAAELIDSYALWPVVESDLALVQNAIARTIKQRISIRDAMVVKAADRCGADTLLSEDIGHGTLYGSTTVVNPFASKD